MVYEVKGVVRGQNENICSSDRSEQTKSNLRNFRKLTGEKNKTPCGVLFYRELYY